MEKKNISGDYRQYMNKNYIGEWDLPETEDLMVTIDHMEQNDIQSERGSEEKLVAYFRENYKPLIVNATNAAAITEATGTSKVEEWAGKKVMLYRENVRAFGKTTLAVRVRPVAPKVAEYFCEDCGVKIEDTGKFSARAIASNTKQKFGRVLCMDCGEKEKARLEEEAKKGDVLND